MCFVPELILLQINMVSDTWTDLPSPTDILFKQHKDEIEAEYNKFKGGQSIKEIAIEKCGFFLPECAYYDYINDAPDDANKATIVKKAMEAISVAFPKTEYQRCIVHQIINTLKYVPEKDRKAFARDLKTIYQAANEEDGRKALDCGGRISIHEP